MAWEDELARRLQALHPTSVCTLDAAADAFAAGVLPDARRAACDPPPAPPCALALGIEALVGLDTRAAEQLVGRVRTYAAPRLLLVAHAGCALDDGRFLALGFTLAHDDRAAGVRLYHFDLDTYKSVPDWLNARFWAHPERWEP
jgi:hypothetical protein